jgi:hypothetical protein
MKMMIATKKGQVFYERKEMKKYESGGHEGSRYLVVALKQKNYYVHRLVWEQFNGPIPEGMVINHIDGNKKNNDLNNLELVTHAENIRHAFESGAHDNWMLSDFEIERRSVRNKMKSTNKHWAIYDLNLNFLCSFSSQIDAARSLGVSRQTANNSFRLGRPIFKRFYICMPTQYEQLLEKISSGEENNVH